MNLINKKNLIVKLFLFFTIYSCGNKSLKGNIIDGSDIVEGIDFLFETEEFDLEVFEYIRSEDFKEDFNPYNFDICPGPLPFDPMPDCVHPEVVANCHNGWCVIPPGCFLLGSPPDEPRRKNYGETLTPVTLTHPFEIMDHEVTQGEWESVGFPNPSFFGPNGNGLCASPDCPVENITFFEALLYANHLSLMHIPPLVPCYTLIECTGEIGQGMVCSAMEINSNTIYECNGYRLPTGAEFEYAARAGSKTAYYSGPIYEPIEYYSEGCFGPDITGPNPCLEPIAWYCINSNDRTHPAKQKEPNKWGLYDILGNVHEFTNDQYDPYWYNGVPITDPTGPTGHENEHRRLTKGCGYRFSAADCRCASNFEIPPGIRSIMTGFRLARTIH